MPSPPALLDSRTSLTELLSAKSSQYDRIFVRALQHIDEANKASTCYQAAIRKLLTACKSAGVGATDPPASAQDLEAFQKIYAARLAICELEDAHASPPPECSPVVAIPMVSKDNALTASAKSRIEACVQGLHANGQSWTSYSNSKQNAKDICQASRVEIEKEELLNDYREQILVQRESNQAFADVVQHFAHVAQSQMAFAEEVKDLQHEHISAMVQAAWEGKVELSRIASDISGQLTSIAKDAEVNSQTFGKDAKALNEACRSSHRLCSR